MSHDIRMCATVMKGSGGRSVHLNVGHRGDIGLCGTDRVSVVPSVRVRPSRSGYAAAIPWKSDVKHIVRVCVCVCDLCSEESGSDRFYMR